MPINLPSLSLLVVDDNEFMLEIIVNLLRGLGIDDIRTASNGRRAIDVLRQADFDLILTDWRMPVLDGGKLVEWVRRSPNSPCAEMPIIMITGNNERDQVILARDVGISEFIVKPITSDVLRTKIKAVLRSSRPFIDADQYVGPCRRRRRNADYFGEFHRDTDFASHAQTAEERATFADHLRDLTQHVGQMLVLLRQDDKKRKDQTVDIINKLGDLSHDFGHDDAYALSQLLANFVTTIDTVTADDRRLVRSLLDTLNFMAENAMDTTHRVRIVQHARDMIKKRIAAKTAARRARI